MRKSIIFLIFNAIILFILSGCSSSSSSEGSGGVYTLVWNDEFSGSSVDSGKWLFEIGNNGGWGNSEQEYYQEANATVTGGILSITAKKEDVNVFHYTSTRMKTAGLFSFMYGKIEARIRIPKGQGLWPAIWMLGTNITSISWPDCGEIDIMEHINTDDLCYGTMHWNGGSGHVSYGLNTTVSSIDTWHIYAVEWTATDIIWFVDGVKYCNANIANNINHTEAFHLPFFLLLNMAVGGIWPGNPDPAVFPAQYQIDYVRVYQKK